MATQKGVTSRRRTKRASPKSGGDVAALRAMVADIQRHDTAQQREIQRLGGMVQQLTQLNSVEVILTNGFLELSEKLGPLEDLSPKRDPLDPIRAEYFERLREAMAQPNWSDATSLPVPNRPVDPIGAPPSRNGSRAS